MTPQTQTPHDQGSERDVEKLFRLIYGFVYFQGLVSAVELGLFNALSQKPKLTAAEIGATLSLNAQSVRALLLGCSYLDLLSHDAEQRYSNTPLTERFLVEGAKESVVPLVRSNNRVQYKALYRMPEALREGKNLGLSEHTPPGDTVYERLANAPELERIFHDAMECFTRHTIDLLAGADELRGVKRVLDVGGGTGQTATALCKHTPDLHVTIFDSPSICARATQAMSEQGLSKRVHTASGDFFKDPFPTGHDAILFSHVIEIYSEAQVQSLLKKSFDALEPGGKVVIWCTAANDGETGGAFAAKISLYFLTLASGVGMTYPTRDYERWMRELGYSSVASRSGLPWEHALIVGTK